MLLFLDFPRINQWNFQDPASPLMEGIIDLHHDIFFVLLLIFGFVTLYYQVYSEIIVYWINPNKQI
jgi:heme/copper-type cytochrome/quinol oxidase subunit 2